MRGERRLVGALAVLGTLALSGCAALLGPREAAYVQTPGSVVEAMLSMAGVGPGDYVVDLGSGDGRIPIAAARQHGARGLGIEREPRLVQQSRANAVREGVSGRVEFRTEDIFTADISSATVVTLYLLPEINLGLRPRLLSDLRPGVRIVSHDFDMGEWKPDRYAVLQSSEKVGGQESRIYLWIVPICLAGHWRGTLRGPGGEEPALLELQQEFQEVRATARLPHGSMSGGGRIQGRLLSLLMARPGAAPLRFTLTAGEGRLDGEAVGGGQHYALHLTRVAE
jgi:hypothetical protein